MAWREQAYAELYGREGGGLTATQRALFATIIVAVVIAVLGTEPELPLVVQSSIEALEWIVGTIFLVEYLTRVACAGVVPEFRGFRGRMRFVRQPLLVVDLLALLPFLLGALGAESMLLRMIRVLRLLALSKLVRYSQAMRVVLAAVVDRRFELMFAVMLAFLMLLFSSAALYVIEGDAQPKAFGSILRSMWWSVITLTTVGYGDIYPVTPLGKVFAALTAVAGIGMIAMPTGILAASFSEGFARLRNPPVPGDTAEGQARR
jgi:voltage-gated potassium channel